MKRRIIAVLTAAVMLLSLPCAVLPAAAADTVATLFTAEPSFVALGTDNTSLFSGSVSAKTDALTAVTFWLRVKDVTEPIYLTGARFGFTTEAVGSKGTDTFATNGSGGNNLQNLGILVEGDGDYLLTVPLETGNVVAWNYTADCGGFESFTSFGIRAYDAAEYDNGTVAATTASAALMGIIEGEPDYENEASWLSEGELSYTQAASYPAIDVQPMNILNNPNLGKNSSASYRTVQAPAAPHASEIHTFTGWCDQSGKPTLSILSDTLYASYENVGVSYLLNTTVKNGILGGESFTADVSDDAPISADSGLLYVSYDSDKLSLIADTDGDGYYSYEYDANSGTYLSDALLAFTVKTDVAGEAAITLSGEMTFGDTTLQAAESSHRINVIAPGAGAVAINKNTDAGTPEAQTLWSGNIGLGDADGLTLVYEVSGVNEPIDLSNFAIGYTLRKADGTTQAKDNSTGWEYWWNQGGHYSQLIEEDGYYYMYINRLLLSNLPIVSLQSVSAFTLPDSYAGAEASNPNENASFRLIGVARDGLSAQVRFHSQDEHTFADVSYTDITGSVASAAQGIVKGKLLSPEEIYADLAPLTVHPCYKIIGWQDKNGNKVECIYADADLYPILALDESAEHSFTDYRPCGDATCTDNGTKTAYCDLCGKVKDTVDAESGMKEHSYVWNTTTEPTAVSEGVSTGTCTCGDTLTKTLPSTVPADINGDGEVNVLDITVLARYIAQAGESGTWDLTASNLAGIDYNNDGTVSQADLLILTRTSLG